MKAISLFQPWATLVATGAKTIETRSWRTHHRGPIAVHAGRKKSRANDLLCIEPGPIHDAMVRSGHVVEEGDDVVKLSYVVGAIVAVAHLVDCVQVGAAGSITIAYDDVLIPPDEPERSFGDYAPGRFAWVLADVRRLVTPIRCEGGRRLFNVPDGLLKRRRFTTGGNR